MSDEVQSAPIDMDQVDALLDRHLQFQSDAWGFATAYDTAITIGGYGAFFALWSGVAEDVTPATRGVTAALLGVSLLIYIAWNLLLMLGRHWHDRELIGSQSKEGLSPLDRVAEWDRVLAKKHKAMTRLQHRFWWPIFGTSALLGFGGGVLLAYNCLAVALGLPQFTGQFGP